MILEGKTVAAVHYKYKGTTSRIEVTDVFFHDGTKLSCDGHWVFTPGMSYSIECNDGNPVDIESVKLFGIGR